MDGETEVVVYRVDPPRHDFCTGCIVEGLQSFTVAKPAKKFITVKQAIIRGRVSETTVHRMLKSEGVHHEKAKSGKLYINRGAIRYR